MSMETQFGVHIVLSWLIRREVDLVFNDAMQWECVNTHTN